MAYVPFCTKHGRSHTTDLCPLCVAEIKAEVNELRSQPAPKHDSVAHPAHYTLGGVEVIDAIEAWQLGFRLGNAVKYIARAGKKDPAKTVEDLRKARWYLDREIGRLEAAAERADEVTP